MYDKPNFRAGLYRHFSGVRCTATHLVRHHETGELFVVFFRPDTETMETLEYDSPGKASWCDTVDAPETPGAVMGKAPRFAWLRAAL